MSLPKNLQYKGKIESSPCRASRLSLAPQNGTGNYGLGDTIILNLPSRPNLLLATSESYLKFNLAVTNLDTGSNTYRWDSCGAHGLIKQIRVWSGSNLISDIDSYSTLAKMLFDLQVPTSATYGKFSSLCGTRPDQVLTTVGGGPIIEAGGTTVNGVTMVATAATDVQLAAILNSLSVSQINTGDVFKTIGTGATAPISTDPQTTYCLNLISLIGSLCQNQYFPLFACQNSTIRVEITLHDTLSKIFAFQGAGAGSILVNNCEYVCNMLELGDSAMAMVQDSLQGAPIQFVVPEWRNFQYTGTAGNGIQLNIPIAAKFASLKSLFITCRDKYQTATYYPQSSTANGIASYYFRVGAQIMPPKPPSTIPEMFAEVLKAIASMSDLTHMPSIDKASYALASSSAQTALTLFNGQTSSGSFYIGLDLENYPNASKDSIYSGWNSNSDDIFCSITYGTVAFAGAIRFDTFANFDSLLVFENGVCYARF